MLFYFYFKQITLKLNAITLSTFVMPKENMLAIIILYFTTKNKCTILETSILCRGSTYCPTFWKPVAYATYCLFWIYFTTQSFAFILPKYL